MAARAQIVLSGAIGEVRVIQTAFSYFNVNPDNVRNKADIGGGGLYDIGCYAIATARFIFGAEPEKVIGTFERDPQFGTDRLCSGLAVFPQNRQLSFVCSTQLVPFQRVQICGTKGRIEVEIPFNAPKDKPCRIFVDDGSDLGGGIRVEQFAVCDQYTLQANAFARAVLNETPWPYPIEDAVCNMRVIDAFFRSAESGKWGSRQSDRCCCHAVCSRGLGRIRGTETWRRGDFRHVAPHSEDWNHLASQRITRQGNFAAQAGQQCLLDFIG